MKRIICLLTALFTVVALYADAPTRFKTIVIDAGHGGKDSGAVSRDKASQEKNFTLDIAKKLKEKINASCSDINVVLTRDTDEFISLAERAEIANKNGANLFISIHINASTNPAPSGYSVHVLGDSSQKNRDLFAFNMDIVKRENSVIFLEDDYTTKYQGFNPDDPRTYIFMTLMQSANRAQSLKFAQIVADKLKGGPIKVNRGISQDPFYVLWKTSMPSVLVELGFISNGSDLEKLRQSGVRDELAEVLFKSFVQYRTEYDSSVGASGQDSSAAASSSGNSSVVETIEASQQQESEVIPEAVVENSVLYGVQIFAGEGRFKKDDKLFLGFEPLIIDGAPKKFIISVSPNLEEAKKNIPSIRKKYKDCFLVRIEGNTTKKID
ncbi:MAG: N-acetylmuramoyl-L-alanine amidase [Bacteroidales bacterium]|nr:N-acetylmuramoyl-L-alanine amidase [Bacteroidales bacterium]